MAVAASDFPNESLGRANNPKKVAPQSFATLGDQHSVPG
jgi:hypothetical protein